MSRRSTRTGRHVLVVLGAAVALVLATLWGQPAGAAGRGSGQAQAPLNVYSASLTAKQAGELARSGHDLSAAKSTADGVTADLVLTAQEASALRDRGMSVKLKRVQGGKTVRQLAAAQAAGGYHVYRSWDEPGGIRDELYSVARQNPQLVKLVVLGHTAQGRELIAVKLTQSARETPDGSRPAVLYSATQHAREWIATEVDRRLMHYFIDKWRANDRETRNLLKTRELWFVVVANPDGYQYTFDHERLWRKNLRDNDHDGQVTRADGVDPNRNYPSHWGYDEEGSSGQPNSDTYRGPSAGSEPETQAIISLFNRVPFRFQVNYHSFGPYLLYPEGWQTSTATADDPIYYALTGNIDNPAIPDSLAGLSSDVLYVTNGEMTDYAHSVRGTLSWTPELEEGCDGCGFVFPDDEDLVQAQFEKTLPFDLDVLKSAADPANPVSHLGIATKPFYLKSDDTFKAGQPLADFTFATSYGDPQEVRVDARRSLGAVTVRYQVNGGPVQSAPTSEWNGGDTYGGQTDRWYHIMSGTVTGTSPGDLVKVWFTGGGQTSDSFTYRAEKETGNRVLVLSAEDYSGASPAQGVSAPKYVSSYQDALAANGIGSDVYDVDAHARTAATKLGVLSHYDAVVWYTGDDVITREPGWSGGTASRLAMDEMLQAREYLNEDGRILFTGKYAGHGFAGGHGNQFYDPTAANARCSDPAVAYRCLRLAGSPSGDGINDTLEYWFGASSINEGAGQADDGSMFDVLGVDTPLTGASFGFNGADSAANQDHSASFLTTSGRLDPAQFPQFRSWAAAKYDRPGGPFAPHTGEHYLYSQIADVSYKQLTRTIDVPAGGGNLSFWTSYDTEPDWDFLFVEAHTVGLDDWTTLPDANGATSTNTGESCPAGWFELHPWLERYQTLNDDGTCSPTGTTGGGTWNAASGNSDGWQQWSVDLGAYAGKQVEVSISYASDWGTQGLGTFVDDVTLPDGSSTSFEDAADPLGGWAISGPPPGSAANPNNWERTTAEGFPEGAVVATPQTVYMGFGFEGITGAATRADVMGKVMADFLP
jgi:hypothetical protein